MSITILTIVAVGVAGAAVAWICNLNRGTVVAVEGVPWVIPVLVVIVVAQSFLLSRDSSGPLLRRDRCKPRGSEACRHQGRSN